MTRGRSKEGFALAETLVASAIVAGMLGITLQVLTTRARTTRMIEDRRLATLVAQSQMSVFIAASDTDQLQSHGRTSGVEWHVIIEPYPTRYAQPRLERVSVDAGTGRAGRPLIRLHSLRIAR